jgi:hypothetical protein
MVIITSAGSGSPEVSAVHLEGLLFQTAPGLFLRTGEFIPFGNLQRIDVGHVKAGIVPLHITFADGTTLAGSVIDGSDLLEGETAHGSLQMHVAQMQQISFPRQAAPAAPSAPPPLVTITTPDGESAQVILLTMRINGNDGLLLRSGEYVTFDHLQRIDIGTLQGMDVPVTLTYRDGSIAGSTVKKDDDLMEGDTLHGNIQKNLYALKQVQFPPAP